jgi:hypothetical protein
LIAGKMPPSAEKKWLNNLTKKSERKWVRKINKEMKDIGLPEFGTLDYFDEL